MNKQSRLTCQGKSIRVMSSLLRCQVPVQCYLCPNSKFIENDMKHWTYWY